MPLDNLKDIVAALTGKRRAKKQKEPKKKLRSFIKKRKTEIDKIIEGL